MSVNLKFALQTSACHGRWREKSQSFQYNGLGVLQSFNVEDRTIFITASPVGFATSIVHDSIDFSQTNVPFLLVLG